MTGVQTCALPISRHINSLLWPIKCREPFDLICTDYLSLPMGKGGFKTILLLIDTFSNFIWAYKLKSGGMGKTMLSTLMDLCRHYRRLDAFMTDGGPHFNNAEVNKYILLATGHRTHHNTSIHLMGEWAHRKCEQNLARSSQMLRPVTL